MKTLLLIQSSPDPHSASRQVIEAYLKREKERFPGIKIITRDLAKNPIPHFTFELSGEVLSNQLCEEVLAADMLLIGAPMWNFGIPSVLKAWVDHIVKAGVTFRYSETGPVGLLSPEKELMIVEAAGGEYFSPEAEKLNHVSPYLFQLFKFLGLRKMERILVGGTAFRREAAVAEAILKLNV